MRPTPVDAIADFCSTDEVTLVPELQERVIPRQLLRSACGPTTPLVQCSPKRTTPPLPSIAPIVSALRAAIVNRSSASIVGGAVHLALRTSASRYGAVAVAERFDPRRKLRTERKSLVG